MYNTVYNVHCSNAAAWIYSKVAMEKRGNAMSVIVSIFKYKLWNVLTNELKKKKIEFKQNEI